MKLFVFAATAASIFSFSQQATAATCHVVRANVISSNATVDLTGVKGLTDGRRICYFETKYPDSSYSYDCGNSVKLIWEDESSFYLQTAKGVISCN